MNGKRKTNGKINGSVGPWGRCRCSQKRKKEPINRIVESSAITPVQKEIHY